MNKKETSKAGSSKNSDKSWRGFDVGAFDGLLAELLQSVEGIQRYVGAVKSVVNDAQKRGTISVATESDAISKLVSACEGFESEVPACLKQSDAVRKRISQLLNTERGSRRIRFEEGAHERGWRIVGNWPEPVVEGIVFVVVDGDKDKATVNGQTIQGIPMSEKLLKQVQFELEHLNKSKLEPQKFVDELWRAYRSCGGKVDEGVLVFDLLREFVWSRQSNRFQRNPTADLFKPYPLAQFRADLTGYLGAGAPPVRDGAKRYNLEVVGGSYAENGLFMYFPQADRLATCGRLTFRSDKS